MADAEPGINAFVAETITCNGKAAEISAMEIIVGQDQLPQHTDVILGGEKFDFDAAGMAMVDESLRI